MCLRNLESQLPDGIRIGLGGLVLLFILWVVGRLGGGLGPGSPYAGVYAETFALWMLLFLALGLAQAYVSIPGYEMLGAAAASFLSLATARATVDLTVPTETPSAAATSCSVMSS